MTSPVYQLFFVPPMGGGPRTWIASLYADMNLATSVSQFPQWRKLIEDGGYLEAVPAKRYIQRGGAKKRLRTQTVTYEQTMTRRNPGKRVSTNEIIKTIRVDDHMRIDILRRSDTLADFGFQVTWHTKHYEADPMTLDRAASRASKPPWSAAVFAYFHTELAAERGAQKMVGESWQPIVDLPPHMRNPDYDKCYACDERASGTKNRKREGEGIVRACWRHRDRKDLHKCMYCDTTVRKGGLTIDAELGHHAHASCHKRECDS